jgi:predicted ArsR family transcriptional regulator
MRSEPSPGKIHRALADEHRARMVDELRRAPHGLDVQQLSVRLGLHPNTIRWHLDVLADAAIVRSSPAGRGRPGRPRILYALTDTTDVGDAESYPLLASILSGALAEVEGGSARAEAAGHAWGRYLARRPPSRRADADQTRREVVELLAQQGFRPERVGDEIRLYHCPYRALAPGIVCSAHRGVIAGALTELGGSVELERLEPLVEPRLCVVRLRSGRVEEGR